MVCTASAAEVRHYRKHIVFRACGLLFPSAPSADESTPVLLPQPPCTVFGRRLGTHGVVRWTGGTASPGGGADASGRWGGGLGRGPPRLPERNGRWWGKPRGARSGPRTAESLSVSKVSLPFLLLPVLPLMPLLLLLPYNEELPFFLCGYPSPRVPKYSEVSTDACCRQ